MRKGRQKKQGQSRRSNRAYTVRNETGSNPGKKKTLGFLSVLFCAQRGTKGVRSDNKGGRRKGRYDTLKSQHQGKPRRKPVSHNGIASLTDIGRGPENRTKENGFKPPSPIRNCVENGTSRDGTKTGFDICRKS